MLNSEKLLDHARLNKTNARISVLDVFINIPRSFGIEELALLSRQTVRTTYNVAADLLTAGLIKVVKVKGYRAKHFTLNKGNK